MRFELWFLRVGDVGPDGQVISFPVRALQAPPFPSASYLRVATLDADSAEHAWMRAQHIDAPWTRGPGIQFPAGVLPARLRSMHIGDVALDADGQAWVVDSVGFVPIQPGDALEAAAKAVLTT